MNLGCGQSPDYFREQGCGHCPTELDSSALVTVLGAQLRHCAMGREHSSLTRDAECWWVAQNIVCGQNERISSCRSSQESSWGSPALLPASPPRNAGPDHTHCPYRTSALNFVPQPSALWALRWPFCSCLRPHTVMRLCWRWQSWHWLWEYLSCSELNRWA